MEKSDTPLQNELRREGAKKKADTVMGCATRRMACVGLDWFRISVSDLFKIFDSVLSQSSPKSVKLYKTKLGRKKFGDNSTYVKKRVRDGINAFYIAITEFKSIEDSILAYNSCDGNELENSGMSFDLRFISDEIVLRNPCDEAFSCNNYVNKEFTPISKDKALSDDEEMDDERETELRRLFDQKEVDFDMVHNFVDMSDDEETTRGFASLLIDSTGTRNPLAGKQDTGDEESDLEEDLNETYKSLSKKSKKKKKNEKESAMEEPKKKVAKMTSNEKAENEYEGFVFDPKDVRFEALFEDDGFSIDPTHPEYRKKSGLKEVLDEKRKRVKGNLD